MRIDSITLKGYGSYKNETAVHIPDGIIGIVGAYDGNERKSNGSGKSTLISSMNYAFFGDGEFEKMSEVVNDQLPGNDEMFARINFTHKGTPYEVERGIVKGSSYLNFKANGVPVHSDSGSSKHKATIKDTTAEIVKVLGMDYEMFTTSVFFEQHGLDKFINVRPDLLRQYIDKVLGIEMWRLAEKDLNKELNKAKDQYNNTLSEITELEKNIKDMTEQLSTREEILGSLEIQTLMLKDSENQRAGLINVQDFSGKITQINSLITDTKEEVSRLNTQLEDEQKKSVALQNTLSQLKQELESVESTSIDDLDSKIYNLEQAIGDQKAQEDFLNTNVLGYTSDLSSLQTKLSMKIEARDRFRVGICSECEQDVTQEYIDKKKHKYDSEIEELQASVADIEQKKSEIDTELSTIKSGIISSESELNELRNLKNDITSRSQQLRIQITSTEMSSNEKSKTLDRIAQDIESRMVKLNDYTTELSELEGKVVEGLSERINTLSIQIKEVTEIIAGYNRQLGALDQIEKNKQNVEKELEDKKSDLNFLEECLYIYNVLVEAFREIPKRIFSKSIIAVQETANNIIHQVFPELSILFYEDTAKKIAIKFDVAGNERRYKRLSGGQRVVVNIGIRLGFSHVIKKRANSNIDLIVLDEPFGALDEENRDLIKTVLANIQQWFRQILVISHVGGVEYFPKIIKVRYSTDRVSYIAN